MVSKSIKKILEVQFWVFITTSLHASPVLASEKTFDYQHGISYIEPLKYDPNFKHFDYVNPEAPKGGILRFPEVGTFYSFNNMVDKGRKAWGMDLLGVHAYTTDSLIEPSIDENASFYFWSSNSDFRGGSLGR